MVLGGASDTGPMIISNTIVGNSGSCDGTYGGGIIAMGTDPKVIGNIVFGNRGSQVNTPSTRQGSTYSVTASFDTPVTYNLVEDGCPGIGNIDGNPAFADLHEDDYHVFPSSDAIDAGDPVEKLTEDYSAGEIIVNVNQVTAVFPEQSIWITDGTNTDESTVLNTTDTTITIGEPFEHSYLVADGAYLYTISSAYSSEPWPNGQRVNMGAYGNTEEAAISIPVAAVLPELLDFGEVAVGSTSSLPLVIRNIGHDILEVDDITSSQSVFTIPQASLLPFSIPPGASQDVTVRFTPSEDIDYSGDLYIYCNDRDMMVQLSGKGIRNRIWEIQLYSGWNLISLPLQPLNADPGVLLSSIDTEYNSVWAYNPDNGWSIYSPGAPGDLDKMEAGKGYWIKMEKPGTLAFEGTAPESTAVDLEGAAWNLVGYSCLDSMDVEECIGSVADDINSVWEYNAVNKTWSIYAPGGPSDLQFMKPGYGYWMKADRGCTWDFAITP